MKVTVFMDVEDPINPASDDAAHEFVRLFDEVGIPGGFCITGDKCAALMSRPEIAADFQKHKCGLHTTSHSVHPTTMELLETCTFEEGVGLAFESESRGFESFQSLLGKPPAFWGGAGNTWSPEITEALKMLGIPAYCYSLTSLPGSAVHRINGVLALPQTYSISETEWMTNPDTEGLMRKLRAFVGPWIGIFVGHPTRFRHQDYWDWGYCGGINPNPVPTTPITDDEDYEKGKANLNSFLNKLKNEFEVVPCPTDGFEFRKPTEGEKEFFRRETEKNIRNAAKWPINRPDIDPANIVAKTLALADTVEIAVGFGESA